MAQRNGSSPMEGESALSVLEEGLRRRTLNVPGAGRTNRQESRAESTVGVVRRRSIMAMAYARAAVRTSHTSCHKTKKLCNACARKYYAPNRLRRYVETVSIPSEYNLSLFHRFVELINWEKVTKRVHDRVRRFGNFLQTHKFEGPLTWEAILTSKIDLTGVRLQDVRSCLAQLGDLLIDPAVDETIESTKQRLRPLVAFSQLQGDDVPLMHKYDFWLRTERKATSSVRRNHFERVADLGYGAPGEG